MKKKIFILFCIFFLISFINAAQISLDKDNYSKKETLIAGVSGEFTESITEENIYLYRNWNRVPFEASVTDIGDMFFISGDLDVSSSGNYTLEIRNVEYKKENQFTKDPFSKNFSIKEDTADFNINPGFIKTDEPFSIFFKNLRDKEIIINPSIENYPSENSEIFSYLENKNEINLNPLQLKEISFGMINETNYYTLILESKNTEYKVPLYMIYDSKKSETKEGTGKKITKEGSKKHSISFDKDEININKLVGSNTTKEKILLINEGNFSENISLILSEPLREVISLKETSLILGKGESKNIFINVSYYAKETNFKGQLKAVSQNASDLIEIYLEFFKEKENLEKEEEIDNPPASQNCSELGGEICKDNEKCIGRTMKAKNGICCLEECEKKESSITGKIVGWIILLVIGLLVYWIYKKYNKTKKEFSIPDQLKKISNLKKKSKEKS